MKHAFLLTGIILLAACAPAMPMNHTGMNHQMDGRMHAQGEIGFLPGQGKDIASLPEAQASEILDVQDGQTINLNPTLVRKTINGTEIAMYGYNGQIPGPLLRMHQGSTFTVNVTNTIDLPTTIHWHGIRLQNANDGAVGVNQEAIAPGDSYTYTVAVPDEGMYWYHTHVREDLEQPMGLYGGIIVTPANADAYEPTDIEQTFMLNDLLLDAQGQPVPYGREEADHTLMGRFGTTFLVNGDAPASFQKELGTIALFTFVNASNTRTYRIVPPPDGMLKIVGGDNGRVEKQYLTDSYTLAPSERVIAEVYFWDDGVNRGTTAARTVPLVVAGDPANPITVQTITIRGGVVGVDRSQTFKQLRTNDDVVKSIDPFRFAFGKEPDHTLLLDMGMMHATGSAQVGGMGGSMTGSIPHDGIEWEDSPMNAMGMSSMMQWKLIDEATGAANEDLVYTAHTGDNVKFRIINKANSPHPMQHPIHFHGQRFLVLSDNDIPNEHLVWKDTVLVPAGHTVDILLDASNPGTWMFHCHIAEHLSNGMMGILKVL